MQIIHV